MQCNYCEWRCELIHGRMGRCKMYYEDDGTIRERFPHLWSSYTLAHIESLPFYHAYPGSRSLSVGTLGCNFDCQYCSNAFVAKQDPQVMQTWTYNLLPEKIVEIAQKTGSHNIVFNINEPVVSLPTLLEVAELARAADIPLGCLTNGYMTEESTALMASAFTFINISLKGFTSDFYRQYTGINNIEPILRNIASLARSSHLEIVTPVIPSVNDADLNDIASFIADINPDIPWHVFRLLPEYKMKDTDYPSIEETNQALYRARKLLHYVYFHNFVGSDWVNTICPDCGEILIERLSLGCGGDRLLNYKCSGEQCPHCGQEIRVYGGMVPWNKAEVAR